MTSEYKSLILTSSPLIHRTRVYSEIQELLNLPKTISITLVGTTHTKSEASTKNVAPHLQEVVVHSGHTEKSGTLTKLLLFFKWQIKFYFKFRKQRYDIIHAHSVSILPLACFLKWHYKAKLVYDTHEVEIDTPMCAASPTRKKLYTFFEKTFIRHADAIVTVGPEILKLYQQRYPNLCKGFVIRNIPTGQVNKDFPPLKKTLNIPAEEILYVYFGIISKARGAHNLIKIFSPLTKHHLLFIGTNGDALELTKEAAAAHENIHTLPPVAPTEVVSYISSADASLVLADASCLNHLYGLPNKLFQSLQANLPVLIYDHSIEMIPLLKQYDCGWITKENIDITCQIIKDITPEKIKEKKQNTHKFNDENSWILEKTKFKALMDHILYKWN